MAFDPANIVKLAEESGVSWYDYLTSDTLATVEGAGYFSTYAKVLDVNDKIYVNASNGNSWYAVATVTRLVDIEGVVSSPAADAVTITRMSLSTANLSDYSTGTWTPTITFTTPGDLNVVYSVRTGTYTKIGRMVHAAYRISTSTFTHTTAVGVLNMTGLPFTAGSFAQYTTATLLGGYTKAGYTAIFCDVLGATTTAQFLAGGSGVAAALVGVADMPTGGTVDLRGIANYET